MHEIDKEIDLRGLSCPLPILKTKKALADMRTGQHLRVLATDPGAIKDFAAFALHSGNQLLESGEVDGCLSFLFQRK